MREALDNLPNELGATYERILGSIDERKSEGRLARHTLAWLAVALEPLRLAQVVNGFSVDAQKQRIKYGAQSLGAALLHALSSLVSYHEETDVLTFSHSSVKVRCEILLNLRCLITLFYRNILSAAPHCRCIISFTVRPMPRLFRCAWATSPPS